MLNYFFNNNNGDNTIEKKVADIMKCTNSCWSGETQILTVDGDKSFKELADNGITEIDVFTSEFKLKKMRNIGITRKKEEIIRLYFNNGCYIACTPDHNLYDSVNWKAVKVMAKDIKIGYSFIGLYGYDIESLNSHGINTSNIKESDISGISKKIIKIENLNEKIDVYNGTIDDTDNYFVKCGNNSWIASANCGKDLKDY